VTNKVLGLEGDVNFKPFEGSNLLVGAEYKHYDWENKNSDLDSFGGDVPGSTSDTSAKLHTWESTEKPNTASAGISRGWQEFGTKTILSLAQKTFLVSV